MLYWIFKRGAFCNLGEATQKRENLTLNLSNPKQSPPSPGIFFFPSAAGRETSSFSSTTAASPFPQAPFPPAKTREQKERRPSLSSHLPPFSRPSLSQPYLRAQTQQLHLPPHFLKFSPKPTQTSCPTSFLPSSPAAPCHFLFPQPHTRQKPELPFSSLPAAAAHRVISAGLHQATQQQPIPFTASSHRRTQRRPTAAAPTDAAPFLIHRLFFAQTGIQQQSPLSSSSPLTSLAAAAPSHHRSTSATAAPPHLPPKAEEKKMKPKTNRPAVKQTRRS